jgi:uncharacterized caspase-like protein
MDDCDQLARNFGLAKGGPDVVGFLYYSGHGVARPEGHENYLIPVDLKDTNSTDFWFDAVKLDDLLAELERAAPFAAHFVVFDACRDCNSAGRGCLGRGQSEWLGRPLRLRAGR